MQANANFLAVRSSKNLFIYDRGQSSLKLLLQRILLPQASFLVSPYFSVMYKFTQSSNDLIAVSKGYLLLADVSESSESQKIDLLAKSGTTECRVSFTVSMTDQYGPIAVKEQIDGRNFKIESSNEFIIKLNDYFGGPSLTYRSPAGGTINHVNKYTIESTTSEKRSHKQDPILFQEIVTIDSNSYYQVSATSSLLLVGLCQLSNASIVC